MSEPGNLYCTLLMPIDASQGIVTGLSFVAALAVCDAVSALLPADAARSLRLKWPNDVLLDGAKISGILLEAASGGASTRVALAIGIGINVAHHPDAVGYPTTSLHARGASGSVDDVFTELAESMSSRLDMWQDGTGFPAIRDAWLKRAAGVGDRVTVNLTNEQLTGTFVGLDDAGAMILRDHSGYEKTIMAGDLYLGDVPVSDGTHE